MNEIETLQNRIKTLESKNERLVLRIMKLTNDKASYRSQLEELHSENERMKAELQLSATKCNKLRYALARLRWEHAHNMETMIDQLYTERPSSWRIYRKSKNYWFDKCQELKKKLTEK